MDHTAGASSQTSKPDLTRKRSVNLFDLPVYSNKNAIDGVLNKFSYASEATDVDGWKHEDCYQICGTDQEAWMRYELNGKYTMARGNLYDLNASGGSGWLEFYDGDDFLAVTPRVDRITTAVDFEIDITDVQFLTVHFCAAESGTWFIADDIILTNEYTPVKLPKSPEKLLLSGGFTVPCRHARMFVGKRLPVSRLCRDIPPLRRDST